MIISIDLDGTLLNSNTIVPKSTIEYLEELKNKGEIIVINTGRAIHSALEVTNGAHFANYIISDTGAIIYDVVNKFLNKNVKAKTKNLCCKCSRGYIYLSKIKL